MKKILIFLLISFAVFFVFSANAFSQNGEDNSNNTNNTDNDGDETNNGNVNSDTTNNDNESNPNNNADDTTNGENNSSTMDNTDNNADDTTNGENNSNSPENTVNDTEDDPETEDGVLDSVPIGYNVEPHIVKVDINGIIVKWETNRDTNSTLYIGETSDFDISNAVASFPSDKKRIHNVTATIESLDPQKDYYLKTVDINVNDKEEVAQSPEITINLHNKLSKGYDIQIEKYKAEIDAYVAALHFKEAIEKTNDLISLMESYAELLSLDNEEETSALRDTLYKLEIAARAKELIDVADDFAKKNVFESALDKYKDVKELVLSKGIEDLISRELLDKKIYQMETAVEVVTLVKHADKLVESGLYDDAKEKYEEALRLIAEAELQDYISVQEINRKRKELSRSKVPRVHFLGGMGVLTNFDKFFEKNYTFISWYGFVAFRFSRVFALGLGINTTLWEVYFNFSLMNTYSVVKKFNHEIYLRLGGLVNFPFWKEITFAGAGGEVTLGYQFGIGRHFGITLDVGTMIFYNLYGRDNLNIIPTMNLGVVLSLGT